MLIHQLINLINLVGAVTQHIESWCSCWKNRFEFISRHASTLSAYQWIEKHMVLQWMLLAGDPWS